MAAGDHVTVTRFTVALFQTCVAIRSLGAGDITSVMESHFNIKGENRSVTDIFISR
jgi:hypothetical protein